MRMKSAAVVCFFDIFIPHCDSSATDISILQDTTRLHIDNKSKATCTNMKSTALEFYEANKNLYQTDAELKKAYDTYKKANSDE